MNCLALATDYDGTLARQGMVEPATVAALREFKDSGHKLVLVTGRLLEELQHIFPHTALFESVVAENGAVLYQPPTGARRILGAPPSEKLLAVLRQRGVHPLSVGQVIVATREPYETVVLQAIRDLGLELEVIFNKGAVMILPTGINKATGLKAALKELGLAPDQVVGVGDAENDHALLEFCGFAVAVANAVPALKEKADWITPSPQGAGVVELIEKILAGGELLRGQLRLGALGDASVRDDVRSL